MLYDPARHEPLRLTAWDEQRARDAIASIVADTHDRFAGAELWPRHPKDADPGDATPATPLYHGAAGVIWALNYLEQVGAASPAPRYDSWLGELLTRNRAWLEGGLPNDETAAYLMGDTPILMMAQAAAPSRTRADRLAALIERNIVHPARELMWGSPGTMLAALFLHERFADERWAELFRRSAEQLWNELSWSEARGCRYWTQDLYGKRSTYIDGVHGFVATASVLIRGRHLLHAARWAEWERVIAGTVARTAIREHGLVNWPAQLTSDDRVPLLQFCHGAPGFVICLADLPSRELDDLLLAAGDTIWEAGPLIKGSNLCHGTGGNGYAFLVLHRRTGDELWLERARAFAMHGIEQIGNDRLRFGQARYSLWTGDLGLAIYLWDCVRGRPWTPSIPERVKP
jgi:hypothetical protein